MIIFDLIVFFSAKVSLFSYFFNPIMSCFLILMVNLFINIFYFFCLFFFCNNSTEKWYIYGVRNVLTNSHNCLEYSPSWETNSFSASQEFHSILWIPKAHKCSPVVPVLSQINTVHASPI